MYCARFNDQQTAHATLTVVGPQCDSPDDEPAAILSRGAVGSDAYYCKSNVDEPVKRGDFGAPPIQNM